MANLCQLLLITALSHIGLALQVFEPWRINNVQTGSNPNRPGWPPAYAGVFINITDPNTIEAGNLPRSGPRVGIATWAPNSANCTAKWLVTESPYGIVYNCTEVPDGNWTMEMFEPSEGWKDPTTNFGVKFVRHYYVKYRGPAYTKTFEGTALINNLTGLCSSGGICGFSLREANKPMLINTTMTQCSGKCI